MLAIVLEAYGGPEKLVVKEVPKPVPGGGEVLIKIKAFGLNHAETFMRKGAWVNEVPIIGIECVGQVEEDPGGVLKKGQTVAALMGGMGRTRNGSYAEFTCVPAANVVSINTKMEWAELAAIPESYATAWACLFENLRLNISDQGRVLLVRGATSTIGQAAINIAGEMGITVWATTRNPKKEELLRSLGASRVIIGDTDLSQAVRKLAPDGIDYVLDLLGNRAFQDSARMVKKGGRVCIAGWLAGLEPVSFDALTGLPPGVDVSLFGSFLFGTADYPLSRIPLQTIVNRAAAGVYRAKPARVFDFKDISEAHRVMESDSANGKLVVRV